VAPGSARLAGRGTCRRPLLIWSTTSSRACGSASGCRQCPSRCACCWQQNLYWYLPRRLWPTRRAEGVHGARCDATRRRAHPSAACRPVGLQPALETAWRDGTTHLVTSPLECMRRLAALVPRPRLHRIRFHGVLAPNAKLAGHGGAAGPRGGHWLSVTRPGVSDLEMVEHGLLAQTCLVW
jgi:hypothetical protein